HRRQDAKQTAGRPAGAGEVYGRTLYRHGTEPVRRVREFQQFTREQHGELCANCRTKRCGNDARNAWLYVLGGRVFHRKTGLYDAAEYMPGRSQRRLEDVQDSVSVAGTSTKLSRSGGQRGRRRGGSFRIKRKDVQREVWPPPVPGSASERGGGVTR